MSDHVWTQENLDAYLAGGLDANARASIEHHLAECGECTDALTKRRRLESVFRVLFADAPPHVNLEDRAIARLRRQPSGTRMWVRYVMAAAAVLVLGFVGAIAQAVVSGEAKNMDLRDVVFKRAKHAEDAPFSSMDVDPAAVELDANINYMTARIGEVSVPGAVGQIQINGGEKAQNRFGMGLEGLTAGLTPQGSFTPDVGKPIAPGGFNGGLGQLPGGGGSGIGSGMMGGMPGMMAGGNPTPVAGMVGMAGGGGMIGAGPPPDPNVNLPGPIGYYNTAQGGAIEGRPPGFGTEFAPDGRRLATSGSTTTDGLGGLTSLVPGMGWDGGKSTGRNSNVYGSNALVIVPGSSSQSGEKQQLAQGGEVAKENKRLEGDSFLKPGKEGRPEGEKGNDPYSVLIKPGDPDNKKPAYFTEGGDISKDKDKNKIAQTPPPSRTEPPSPPTERPPISITANPHKEKPPEEAQPEPEKKPAPGRKIIRTGEIEFETESFDKAAEIIGKIIDAVKGRSAFIATTNSDKLPNGKMKGSIIVRMPPEHLDKFITDLRKALETFSGLKGQRIGSLDVTKQYTDIESRLRASRITEKRLQDIIKNNKGEVKDFVLAEKELSIILTKIEEMEGEIRYYNNQVALSTLTIVLVEKEIQAPTAIIVRENVNMHVEVEEVEKAQGTVVSAANLAKGRITKSEMKLFEAGQLRAIVHAEIPPDAADTFRDLVKKLGILTHHESERTQQAEGGSGRPQDGKPKVSDVHFDLQLFNTANIRPRETFTIRVASSDVAGNYQKLMDAVAKLKGRVRKGALDENDKPNMHAEFDFDIFTQDKAEIEKLISAAGAVMYRKTEQAPVNQIATSSKVGYQVLIRNLAGVMPRETFTYEVTVADVAAAFRKLYDEVSRLDGRVITRHLNEQDKFNVSAKFDFDISAKDKAAFDKLLADAGAMAGGMGAGMIALRDSVQATNKEESTDLKVGYRLSLRSINSIPPRDIFTIGIASKDVPATYRKLQEEVAKLKGRVHKGQLAEQDKFNVQALFDFDVDAQDKLAIDALLAQVGVVVSRNNDQAGPKDDATELKVGYRLIVRNVAGAPPREKTTVIMQVDDVDKNALELRELILASKGRVVTSKSRRDSKGQTIAEVIYEVPLPSLDVLVAQVKNAGKLLAFNKETNSQVPDNEIATGQIFVTLSSVGPIIPQDEGIEAEIRSGLYWAGRILSKLLMFLLIGLALVVPVALVIWIAVKLISLMTRGTPRPALVAVTPSATIVSEKPAGNEPPSAS